MKEITVNYYDEIIFPHEDRYFVARRYKDEFSDFPWGMEEGHGVISRDGPPKHEIGRTGYFYDFKASQEKAKNEGWSAELDFKRLQAWANDEWHYTIVSVTEIQLGKVVPNDTFAHSVSGVKSDFKHWIDIARDLARLVARNY